MMQRSIVCGVDGSARGARALASATWLAGRLDAKLLAVHVAPKPSGRAARGFGSRAQASDAAQERGNGVLSRELDRADLPRRHARLVEVGDPAARLIAVAREHDAALVVAGSRGGGALQNALLGSVSRQLVRSCDRPVVVVPQDADSRESEQEAESLVCGVDGSEQSDRVVSVAADLAVALDLCLVIVHVYRPVLSEAAIPASSGVLPIEGERLRAKAKREGAEVLDRAETMIGGDVQVRRKLVAGDPGGAVVELAERDRAAMVVVGSRGNGPVKAALTGSVSSAVLGAARVPVVVVTADTTIGGRDGAWAGERRTADGSHTGP